MKKPRYYRVTQNFLTIHLATRKAAEMWLSNYGTRNGTVYAITPIHKRKGITHCGRYCLFSVRLRDGDLVDHTMKSALYKGRNRYRNN